MKHSILGERDLYPLGAKAHTQIVLLDVKRELSFGTGMAQPFSMGQIGFDPFQFKQGSFISNTKAASGLGTFYRVETFVRMREPSIIIKTTIIPTTKPNGMSNVVIPSWIKIDNIKSDSCITF